MNIRILNSWILEYLKTAAKPATIAEKLSLTSVSVEKIEKHGDDYIYEIEVTTNRPDLMSVIGIARETAAILPHFDIDAKYTPLKVREVDNNSPLDLKIVNDLNLVNRICAVAIEVKLGPSPKKVTERLEAADIRSLNNAIDVTNYVMREVGHPMHAFDYDKLLKTGSLIVRESKKDEKIKTLDGKEHELAGGDIVADDGTGRIIDLLGVMGTENSAVDDNTKRVLLFVDNNNPVKIRKTSMNLGIRSEAAVLNEKGVDPELAMQAILRGVELLEEIANGKVISKVFDTYPNKPKPKTVTVSLSKISSVIGVDIPTKLSVKILEDLGFDVSLDESKIKVNVPSWRLDDVEIPEDLIEEIARVYGFFKLPSLLPQSTQTQTYNQSQDYFYFERRVRSAMKYWGFTEIYTYPMVSEDMLEISTSDAVAIKNPLTEDHIFMRTTLVPSLLTAARENKNRDTLNLFEIANAYHKNEKSLPDEKLMLAGVLKSEKISFLDGKGVIERVLEDLGIKKCEFKPSSSGTIGADIYIGKDLLGQIEQLEANLVDFELDFDPLVRNAKLNKIYRPVS